MSGAELICRDVAASPGGTPVLRGVSLAVAARGRLAVVGPSGAGKTTLLRAIAGLQSTDGGEIVLGGESIEHRSAHRRGLAVVFQEPRLLPHLSALDNVALPLRAAGIDRRERRAAASSGLADVGLTGFDARRIQGLSGGEQQRVALARALCSRPRLLLLDEPLAALDPERRAELRALILRLQRERDLTMVLVTHDRAEAAEMGESIAFMNGGRIVQQGAPVELFERPASVQIARFFGASNLIDDPGGPLTIRPEHVRLTSGGPSDARVVETTYVGEHVRVVLDRSGTSIVALVPPDQAPVAGAAVGVELPPERLWRLPPPG